VRDYPDRVPKPLSWVERMKKDKKFAAAVKKLKRMQIEVNCTHCGAMLLVSAETGKVGSSFGPVTLEDPKPVTQYRFLKVEERPRGRKGKR
jgi:hypothetical protein